MKKHSSSKTKKQKKKGSPLSLLFVALILFIAAIVLLRFSGIGAAPGSDSFKRIVSSTQLMQNAKLVKQDLKDIAYQMKDNDITSMEYSSRKLDADVAVLKEYLSTPVWTIAEAVPVLGQDVKTAKALVEVSETFSNDLLRSWIDLQKKAPYTELKTEEGYNYELFDTYLSFAEENLPAAKSMVDRLDKLNLRLVDEDGKITAYIKLAKPLLQIADEHFGEVIRPGLTMIAEAPPSELKTEDGFNLKLIKQYYTFLCDHLPAVKSMLVEADAVDLSLIDHNGKIDSYLKIARPLVGIVETYSESVLTPGLTLVSEHPLSSLKTDDGFDLEAVGLYSDFLHENQAEINAVVKELDSIDFSPLKQADKIRELLDFAPQLLDLVVPANEELLRPALQLMAERPFSSVKADGGFRVSTIYAYLTFAEEKFPILEETLAKLETMDFSRVNQGGKLDKYLEKIDTLRDAYSTYKDYIPAVKTLIGDGSVDKLYAFPAQNSAEIRASGGFPGDVGTIQVGGDVLMVNQFLSVYISFRNSTPPGIKITPQELRIFTARMYAPRDVDFCIDFERVAEIWDKAYEYQTGQDINGIISATPVVVQKLLSVCDEPVVLSNGMVLDGTTATRVLQRDLYFEYKSAGKLAYTDDDMTDILFSETIKKTMEQVTSNLDLGHILDYLRVLKECIDERIIMVWMEDPEEQEIMRQAGWSGSLNSDPQDPKLGIFFSSEQSGKMGYFFDMIPEIGEPVINEDGSRTYDVTITLNNVVTKEEQRIGGTWILGRNYVGSIVGDLTLTAPAGGVITDTNLSIPRGMRQEEYMGLDTHYIQWLIIERESPIYVRFKVTTAPGVDAPLGIMSTPTLTNYRS